MFRRGLHCAVDFEHDLSDHGHVAASADALEVRAPSRIGINRSGTFGSYPAPLHELSGTRGSADTPNQAVHF